jgi:2-dehydro-3-deoxyphosphooctonate aldolase (KDO 8-P synthase)
MQFRILSATRDHYKTELMMGPVRVNDIVIGDGYPLVLIAGPCVVESNEILHEVADVLSELRSEFDIPLIYKSSYKKANRTNISSFTGIDMHEALEYLAGIRAKFGFPILTDVHSEAECGIAARYVDVLQIPAFLCRQTELLNAAGASGKPVNIKKGQFMSPELMKFQAEKAKFGGAPGVLLTERGTTFGYNDLIVDMRSILIMKQTGYPVIFDATHSVQIPGGGADTTGGRPEFIAPLARAAVAIGCDGVFVETHPDPKSAKSDSASQLPLKTLRTVWEDLLIIRDAIEKHRKEHR